MRFQSGKRNKFLSMNFISSVRFNQETLKTRRSKVRSHTQQYLPDIRGHREEKDNASWYTPIKLKYVPAQEALDYETCSLARDPRRETLKRRVNSQIDYDLDHMNAALKHIRKQIITQQQNHFRKEKFKEKRKYMLTEVGDHREEDEREVKSLWHYKQIDKYQKKLMLKPVWTQNSTHKKLENRVYIDPPTPVGSYTNRKILKPFVKQSLQQLQYTPFDINALFPRPQKTVVYITKEEAPPVTEKIQQQPVVEPVVKAVPRRANPKALKNFRRIGDAVLFTIYLRTFNERMHLMRKTMFSKYLKTNLTSTLLDLKQTLIQYSAHFFKTVIDHQGFDYHLYPKEDAALKREKAVAVRKLVGVELECLKHWVANFAKEDKYVQLFYFLCRHGNYSCLHSIHTPEQINIMCISPTQGYVSASQHLEKSALISLLFIKMLLYNIFFTADTVNIPLRSPLKKQIIVGNIILIGNILYELFIDLQDEYLEQSPAVYTVGNWTTLQHRFNFKVADNMTVKEGVHQTNELISGLIDHQLVKQQYHTHEMDYEKHQIKKMLSELHQGLVRYHLKLREKCFLK